MRVKMKNIATVQRGYSFRSYLESSMGGDVAVIQMKDLFDDNTVGCDGLVKIDMEVVKEHHLARRDAEKHEWKKVKLWEICKITKGKQLNVDHMEEDGAYYALNGGIKPSGKTDNWNTEAGTITIIEGDNTERFWSGGHCYSLLNINLSVNSHYLFFYLKINEPKLMKLRVGSGLPNIQKKDIDRFKTLLPSLPDQRKIAETLSVAQQEIDL